MQTASFKLVVLWTDVALWVMGAALLVYLVRLRSNPQRRELWLKMLRDPAPLCAGLLLLLFMAVTMVDSVHFRRALPAVAGSDGIARTYYDTRTMSLLDVVLARPLSTAESSYSEPLAWHALNRQPVEREGQIVRDVPRLAYGGAHLRDPEREWLPDVLTRAATGAAVAVVVALIAFAMVAAWLRHAHGGVGAAARAIAADATHYPVRAALWTVLAVGLVVGPVVALMGVYHVFGTDRTGNDVLVQTIKSVRTAFVIGALATVATLPLAVGLGVLAGYFRGWVDDVIQYVYTTLTSIPSVLLIAACVLMVQVFLDKNPDLFETGVERADLKMFILCLILGLTGWSQLCRLVRAETLKLRELEYVQAATAFGVSSVRIMARHIVPNLMHLVLITTVLSFSELILFEAVLTYVGVGVDPSMSSFGGMINLARSEMSRDPVVWWSFAAAFVTMVTLVLAANLFADGVRDAFDPRSRSLRPRILSLARR